MSADGGLKRDPDALLWWGSLAVCVLCAVVPFLPSLDGEFLGWDDQKNFLMNLDYRGMSWVNVSSAFTTFRLGVYQPFAWLLFSAQYIAFGMEPIGYHAVSLLLHAINSVLLFLVILEIADARLGHVSRQLLWPASAAVVGLFMMHPLRVEAVAWVSAQPYLPCIGLSLLSVLFYLRAHRRGPVSSRDWSHIGAAFVAALLFKAPAVVLPAVFLLCDYYPLQRMGATGDARWRRAFLEKIPLFAVSAAFMAIAILAKSQWNQLSTLEEYGVVRRLVHGCYGYWFYLWKTVWPVDLTMYYATPAEMNFSSVYALGIIGVAVVTAVTFLRRHLLPGVLCAWLYYLVTLAPTAGFVRIGHQLAADRYSYLTHLAFSCVVALGIAAFLHHFWRSRLALLSLAAAWVVLVIVLGSMSWSLSKIWHDTATLWRHALAHGGAESAEVLSVVGGLDVVAQRYDDATVLLEKARAIDPKEPDAYVYLGVIAEQAGRDDDAERIYREGLVGAPTSEKLNARMGLLLFRRQKPIEAWPYLIASDPEDPRTRATIGQIGVLSGHLNQGITELEFALSLDPTSVSTRLWLALAYVAQGRLPEARKHYDYVTRTTADLEPRLTMAAALGAQNYLKEAHLILHEVLRQAPDDARANAAMGETLLKLNQPAEALTYLEKGDPEDGLIRSHRGVALFTLGRSTEAMHQFEEGVRLSPRNGTAWLNWGVGLLKSGAARNAAEKLERAVTLEPNNLNAQVQLARAYLASGRRDRAQAIVSELQTQGVSKALPAELQGLVTSRSNETDSKKTGKTETDLPRSK